MKWHPFIDPGPSMGVSVARGASASRQPISYRHHSVTQNPVQRPQMTGHPPQRQHSTDAEISVVGALSMPPTTVGYNRIV